MKHAGSLARAGLHGHATAEVESLGGRLPPLLLFEAACIHALNAAAVAKATALPLPLRENYPNKYARTAVALLHGAARGGYFRNEANQARLHKDHDLAFLRDRDDFRAFVKSLEHAPSGR